MNFGKPKIPVSRLPEADIFAKRWLNPTCEWGCAENEKENDDDDHDRCENMNPPSVA